MTTIRPTRGWFDIDLKELANYRELLYFLVWRDIKVRYKQTAIGIAWAVVQPIVTMIVFSIFFGRLAKIPSGELPYPIFYMAALLPWLYFAGALTNATNTIVDHQRVITKVYFPRLLLPVAAVLPGLLDFFIGLGLLAVMVPYYGIRLRASLLLLPVFILLASLTALGVGLWLSALNARYRDVRYAVPFLVQFWMFLSPVAYPSSMVPVDWQWLYGLNPMVAVIEGFRWALTGSGAVLASTLVVSLAAVLLVSFGGLLVFNRMEATIADVV